MYYTTRYNDDDVCMMYDVVLKHPSNYINNNNNKNELELLIMEKREREMDFE